MKEVDKTKKLIHELDEFIAHTPWKEIYASRIESMAERVYQPCELAIVGRMNAGKSSFLNALLDDDLAVVGDTETTATINYFRYGTPVDNEHPVRVVWEDGTEEWQTRAFLDSLQGHTQEVLDNAYRIDHLEYFVPNSILSGVTLVDTPGTGSIVNEHESRTNDYLKAGEIQLREKHNSQSVKLKNHADAVIVITERVPTSETSTLVSNLSMDTSAFNALGVMTKIDFEESTTLSDWNRRCGQYAAMLKNQLNTIVPVSASVYQTVRQLEKTGRLREIQDTLAAIPNDEFQEVCSSENLFMGDDDALNDYFNTYGISYDQRCKLVKGIANWMTFYTIAKVMHEKPYEEALKYLIDYSGMQRVKELVEKIFLSRSRSIRCAKIVQEMYSILQEIHNRRLHDLRTDVGYRNLYLKIISDSNIKNTHLKQSFEQFVRTNVCTQGQYDDFVRQIKDLMLKVENLQRELCSTDRKSEALLLLESKHEMFSAKEYEELEILFGRSMDQQPDSDRKTVARRQAYWRARKNTSTNQDVNKIIELAVYAYGTIKLQ